MNKQAFGLCASGARTGSADWLGFPFFLLNTLAEREPLWLAATSRLSPGPNSDATFLLYSFLDYPGKQKATSPKLSGRYLPHRIRLFSLLPAVFSSYLRAWGTFSSSGGPALLIPAAPPSTCASLPQGSRKYVGGRGVPLHQCQEDRSRDRRQLASHLAEMLL